MRGYLRRAEVIWDLVDGTMTLCDTRQGTIYELNDTGSIVWRACDGGDVDQIVAALLAVFPDQDADVLHAQVTGYVSALADRDLVTLAVAAPEPAGADR